jgi:chitinase
VFQEYSIKKLLEKGAPPNKLVLGLPLYGRIFKLSHKDGTIGFGKPAVAGALGPYVQENGFWGYNEVSWHFCIKSMQ